MTWDDKTVTKLKRLWADGLSASQCAMRLGSTFTRNMVISKVHRMGLAKRESTKRLKTVSGRNSGWHKTKTKAAKPVKKARAAGPAAAVFQAEPFVSRGIDVPESERKTLDDLGDRDCRFPYGDGPFTFCARQKVTGLPYCAEHVAIAYRPPEIKSKPAANRVPVAAGGQTGVGGGMGSGENDNAAGGARAEDLEGVE
jgi:GcrA cell cycle regulator